MKNRYWTAETIGDKSREFIDAVAGFASGEIDFAPAESALLVIDMQRYFLDEKSHAFIASAPAIIPRIQGLIEVFRESERPIIFTRHINTPSDAEMMAEWWGELISEKDPLSEITSEFAIEKSIMLKKSQYDAFYKTPLESILEKSGVSQVVITGVMTHLCCETTARSAFVRGFKVFFPVDSTATCNEEHHRATLLNLAHGFAAPVLSENIVRAFSGGDSG